MSEYERLAAAEGLLPAQWGVKVAGRCPACRMATLFLRGDGRVTCVLAACPRPALADEVLHASGREGVVRVLYGAEVTHRGGVLVLPGEGE